MSREAEMEIAHKWADQVSKHLDGWMIGGGEGYWPHFSRPNGARVTIHQALGKRDRYTLRGIYPTEGVPQTSLRYSLRYYNVLRYDEDPQDIITVSAKREPERAARDIARRLLPRYLDLYERCLEKVRTRKVIQVRRLALAEQLRKAAHGRIPKSTDTLTIHDRNDSCSEGPRFVMEMCGDDEISLSLTHVPFDLALQIARLIGDNNKETAK